jgi:hypothetical protein
MPKGPRGEKRPADVIGAAVMVAKIATGEIEDKPAIKTKRTKSGKAGGIARAKALSNERLKETRTAPAQRRKAEMPARMAVTSTSSPPMWKDRGGSFN